MGYQNVLVAFDGSEGSLNALNHAIDYKKNNGGELTVAHVVKPSKSVEYPPGQIIGGGMVANEYPGRVMADESITRGAEENRKINSGMESEALQKGEEVLGGAKTELTKENIEAHTEVLEGNAAENICNYAKENDIDLIVIGHRGLSGLKKLVLGSVSQKVTEHSDCAVLVVK